MDESFSYQVHVLDEISTAVCLAFRKQPYPARGDRAPEQVRKVLEKFKQLRIADDVIYLRSGSLNLINGIVASPFLRRLALPSGG